MKLYKFAVPFVAYGEDYVYIAANDAQQAWNLLLHPASRTKDTYRIKRADDSEITHEQEWDGAVCRGEVNDYGD